jgi:hypothetical protein
MAAPMAAPLDGFPACLVKKRIESNDETSQKRNEECNQLLQTIK